MTTLYKPVTIASAEQAEALPFGTVVQKDVGSRIEVAVKHAPWAWWIAGEQHLRIGIEWPIGWTALVPIEAEEEVAHMDPWEGIYDPTTWEEAAHLGPIPGQPLHTRLVTPWEEA